MQPPSDFLHDMQERYILSTSLSTKPSGARTLASRNLQTLSSERWKLSDLKRGRLRWEMARFSVLNEECGLGGLWELTHVLFGCRSIVLSALAMLYWTEY